MDWLRAWWCHFWHRDQWVGYGEGDTWFLECLACREKWTEFRTGSNKGASPRKATDDKA